MAKSSLKYKLVVIGGSAGSLEVILKLLPALDKHTGVAIVIVLHRKSASDSVLVDLLAAKTVLPVSEAEEKEPVLPDHIYIAPPDYHLLFEEDETFALDVSEKIYYSRPSIDAAFDSAAEIYGDTMVGILLSGANADGVTGLEKIRVAGGLCIVQEPTTAEVSYMPQQAIAHVQVHKILTTEQMAACINNLNTDFPGDYHDGGLNLH